MKEYVLSIDCCSAWTTLGLAEDGTVKGEVNIDAGKRQSVVLPTLLQHFLEAFSLETKDISLFSVVSGPGSFTGIKVGISFTAFLAWAGGQRVLPLSALECMAFEKTGGEKGIAAPVLWAGGGKVYAGLFGSRGARYPFEKIVPSGTYAPEDFFETVQSTGVRSDEVFWLTDKKAKTAPCFPSVAAFFEECIPRGASTVALALSLKGANCSPMEVRAQYLRDPDLR